MNIKYQIALVNCSHTPAMHVSEQPLVDYYRKSSIEATTVVWNDPKVDWAEYDCLVLRSVWDYHKENQSFNAWLDHLEHKSIRVFNSIDIVRFNQHKFYLKELENKGVKIAPTLFIDKGSKFEFSTVNEMHWDKLVIKPAISASAFLTSVYNIDELDHAAQHYAPILQERDLLIQKFLPEIQSDGEYSLLFFNRQYVYTILKTAKPGEFRIQAEYGGLSTVVDPPSAIIESAQSILSLIPGDMLYARVDGLVIDGEFVLMEVELIEPLLFLDHVEGAYKTFVDATITAMTNR